MPALRITCRIAMIGALSISSVPSAQAAASVDKCANLVQAPYNKSPAAYAPDGTRGQGISIWIKGESKSVPDTKAGCLPIALRYNNPGNLKTPAAGPWAGQIAKDAKGHAVFSSVQAGVSAWGLWIKRRIASGRPATAMSLMSLYAPEHDCVGSIGKWPDCPYGPNPTREYAARIATAVGKGPDDVLNIDGTDCKEGRSTLYSLFLQVFTFEAGGDFCGRKDARSAPLCMIDRDLFDLAMDDVYAGPGGARCLKKT